MADLYVRSTDGSDADGGTTWALAKATLAGAAAIDGAGDTIWVSDAHAESSAAPQALAFAGTIASPTRVICGDDVAEPPTAVTTTGSVATTAGNAMTFTGNAYLRGITFAQGDGASFSEMLVNRTVGGTNMFFESCSLQLGTTSALARISIGPVSTLDGTLTQFRDTTFKFASASQRIMVASAIHINGGSLASGSSAITSFFEGTTVRPLRLLVENFDLSSAAQGVVLMQGVAAVGAGSTVVFRNMKLPATWNGTLMSAAPTIPGCRVSMFNCAAGDTNYALWIEDYCGSIRHETTVVRTGGASDGTTTLAWKMVTSASANYPLNTLESPEIVDWNSTTGASKTLTVEIIHDSVTALTDGEVWIEVSYLGTPGFPLGISLTDAKADVLASAVSQATSTETWTTTGLTNPNKQKLSVTFTPQEVGFYIAKVVLAKASYTVYVDPKATVV